MAEEPGRYALALEEARRALDRQAEDVSSIRARTTTLVSVGGLAAAFLGGLAVRDSAPLTVWTVLGAAAFAALLVVAAAALFPRRWAFIQRPSALVGWADNAEVTIGRMERNLALHMGKHYRANEDRLERLTVLYGMGLALLVFEVVLLLLDLRGR